MSASRLAAVIGAAALVVVVVGSGGTASRTRVGSNAPDGLTRHGRVVWNLEGLLYDTFGHRNVYLNSRGSSRPSVRNFSRTLINNAHSAGYLFTFADARGSQFKLTRQEKPWAAVIGASGGDSPLEIKGSFISCGDGKWLFEHYGNGPANWQVSCHG
jgi:hypothetical protein